MNYNIPLRLISYDAIQSYKTNLGWNVFSYIEIDNNNINEPLSIYPNPVEDHMTIESPTLITNYSIYNTQGIKKREHNESKNTHWINTSNLNSGIYILKVITEDMNEKVVKFIKK